MISEEGGNIMYIPLGIKSDYSLLQSLIKIPDLINYLKENNVTTCGLLDDNLFGSMCFYDTCIKEGIKPIIGLKVNLISGFIYLYAKNYNGYQNLLKVNTLIQENNVNFVSLKLYNDEIICVIPYSSLSLFEEINNIYDNVFISYKNQFEKSNSLLKSKRIVFLNEIRALDFQDIKYLGVLAEIATGQRVDLAVYTDDYYCKEVSKEDIDTISNFCDLINLEIPKNGRYIPHFDNDIVDSFDYLVALCKRGLDKRLGSSISKVYIDRLNMELDVINKMGFVDYFLIVYDYVKYAKTHNILVGPGRGSAAGSLVSYAIGITNVDPIKYNLLFERFLNPERITMPDIDIDFEYTKRDQVVEYVKERYGKDKVANIITFGTLGARLVVRDVGRCLNVDSKKIDYLSNLLDPKLTLKDNLNSKYVKDYLAENEDLRKVYQVSFKLEGLKRHISTHAAGVVISSVTLDTIIPICNNNGELLTGVTMEYLEELGLLKMDFLALRNLTIIQNVLELIYEQTGKKINLSLISLEDKATMEIFKKVDTEGIFQFESSGMKNLVNKMKPDSFDDLVASVALFRPGPMQNIDSFIRRKHGIEKIEYYDDSLKDILQPTYGIMIYQEQIMQILVKMADYSFAEADNIRRAMSKKKHEVMEREREVFITKSVKNGYTKEKAEEVYDLIIKFANYGFNKAHSVSYALIGYQMAYLKANYPIYFIANLLNMSIGSDVKTKEYLDEAKAKNIAIMKPIINISKSSYVINNNSLLLPLNVIHNVGISAVEAIIEERNAKGNFKDFFSFVARVYGKSVNRKTIEALIDADCFREFGCNHKTLYQNIDSAIDYAMLCSDLDESFVMKPNLIVVQEFSDNELMARELSTFGYYVTNHPASKYQEGIMKLQDIKKYFDKYVNCVTIVLSVKRIKTKAGEEMGFVVGSDETGTSEFIVFPKNNKFLIDLKKDDLIKIRGQVTRRFDKYQIVVSSIEKL